MSGKVKLSEARCCLGIAGLMRGPVLVPQADLAGAATAGAGASDGNARCDSVSTCAGVDALARGLAGESFKLGNGSGAPSSSCLFYVFKVF
jgi:hypothetical protein